MHARRTTARAFARRRPQLRRRATTCRSPKPGGLCRFVAPRFRPTAPLAHALACGSLPTAAAAASLPHQATRPPNQTTLAHPPTLAQIIFEDSARERLLQQLGFNAEEVQAELDKATAAAAIAVTSAVAAAPLEPPLLLLRSASGSRFKSCHPELCTNLPTTFFAALRAISLAKTR